MQFLFWMGIFLVGTLTKTPQKGRTTSEGLGKVYGCL